MDGYLARLLAADLPVPVWGLASLWAVFFAGSYALLTRSRSLRAAQRFVSLPPALAQEPPPRRFVART